MDTRSPRGAVVAALAAIALWGSLAILALRLSHLPPFLLVGCALLLGGLVGARRLGRAGVRPRLLLLGVYGLFAYHFCLFVALRLAPPIEANLLNYLWPLLIVVLSPLFVRGAPLSARHVVGALAGFAGAATLVSRGVSFGGGAVLGYALAALAAVIWSTFSLASKRLGGFETAAISTFCLASGALAIACHLALEPRQLPRAGDLPALLAIGLGPMGLAFHLWDRAMRDGDPRVVGTLAYLTPLLSTALLAAFGEARLDGRALLAGVLIVGGAAVSTLPLRGRGPTPAAPR